MATIITIPADEVLADSRAKLNTNFTNLNVELGGKEASGTAATKVSEHEAKLNPHPQYVTDSKLETALETALGDYVTETTLAAALTTYVSTSDLNVTLENYVTGSALASVLTDYASKTYVGDAISSFATSLGDAAALDVGTIAGTVAAGNDGRFHTHSNIIVLDKLGDVGGVLYYDGKAVGGGGGSGTVTKISVVSANGVSGSVANDTTTPAITLTLGDITPTKMTCSGTVSGTNLSGTNTGDQTDITGNAGTATKLQTARNINGQSFDGTADITITTITGNAGSATKLATARNINGQSFDGTADITITTITGNAGTATKLATARNINGVAFDGTGNITVPAAGSTLTDTVPVTKGGTGLTALGTANQSLRVNSGGTALEYYTPSAGGGGSKTLASFTARDMRPFTGAYAALDTRNGIDLYAFDDTTQEGVFITGLMPEGTILTSGVVIILHWAGATATSGAVVWDVRFEKTTGQDIDSNGFDTSTLITSTTNATSGIMTAASATITTIDSIAAGDVFRIWIARTPNDAADVMVGDAQLVAVELRNAA